MIDKNGNIMTVADRFKRCYHFIKNNTAQIALVIPIAAALFTWILNYYFYISDWGYYRYFGIDSKLMLPFDKFRLYQNVVPFAILVLYWVYALFAVRMFKLKRNFLWKFVSLFLIPLLINCGLAYGLSYDNEIDLALIITAILLMPLQWARCIGGGCD